MVDTAAFEIRLAAGVVRNGRLEMMPLSLHKQPATRNPRSWITGAHAGRR